MNYSIKDGVLEITIKNIRYTLQQIIDDKININMFRLYKADLVCDHVVGNMWVNSDAEGALKINSEPDFVCGFHGDEHIKTLKITVDGKVVNLHEDVKESEFRNIMVICDSTVYHCNESADKDKLALLRNKVLEFEDNSLTVTNTFECMDTFHIDRGALALFQCYKTDADGRQMLKFVSSNTDETMYEVSAKGKSALPDLSVDTTAVYFHTKAGKIKFEILQGQNEVGYTPHFHDFADQNRIKIYFDCYNNTDVLSGTILKTKFIISTE